MNDYVLGLDDVDEARAAEVGWKAARLGVLRRMEGVQVPPGFCVTTAAFRRFMAGVSDPRAGDLAAGSEAERQALQRAMEAATVPEDVAVAVTRALSAQGPDAAYAVRSSATGEDRPEASAAGQQDTLLNVVGAPDLLSALRRCWASLFSARAVAYRARSGLEPRDAAMAVLVQRMVEARASGVLFTADPLTGHRRTTTIEACVGLGEALMSGRIDGDVYRVRGEVVTRPERAQVALTDAELRALVEVGRRIEGHFGRPQDIEWCLAKDGLHIVQSRPITTLFPAPAEGDDEPRVYLSVGHQQMMTDAMTPLGRSIFQRTAGRPMVEAGSRLFVDVTRALAPPPAAARS